MAIYVKDSKNAKLAGSKKVDCTYAPIKNTCPNSCPLKQEGCYALYSYVGIVVKRLEKEMNNFSPLQAARAEAKAIDNSYKGGDVPVGRDLRLHVAGDSRTLAGTRLINNAVKRWKKRGGGDVWSYTHAWQHVPREEWDQVSILASITTVDEVPAAKAQGYAPAIVVPEHPSEKAYLLPGSDTKWIPCPAQTKPGGKEIGCSDCRLCFNSDRLFKTNMGIAFSVHGVKKDNIKRRLIVVK